MMVCDVPRILISSPGSSSGKTTVTCALLSLFPNAAAVKCGPDFIDPLFHQQVLGKQTGNVDLFFTTADKARAIFAHDSAGADIAVCEGAMGFYDGAGGTEKASAYETAQVLGCPVILVVDVKGKSLSVCAEINGFASFREKNGDRSGVSGVILNRCSHALYETLSPLIEKECGIKVVGFLEENEDFAIESRHLGLVTPDAVQGFQLKVDALTRAAKKSFNIEEIVRIAQSAPSFEYEDFFVRTEAARVRIAVAKDEAFCFYYRENLALLEAFGAELVYFSPLRDRLVPAGCSALYLGGGYPQLFPVALAENTTMLQSVRDFCRKGAPVFAECGGFLYLKLAGILEGTFENQKRLVRFGYVTLTANEDTLLCRAGEQIRAHEFHYFDTTKNGTAFTAHKANGKEWECIESARAVSDMHVSPCGAGCGADGCGSCAGCEKNSGCGKDGSSCAGYGGRKENLLPNIVAGFPHLYFASNPDFARNLVRAAAEYSAKKAGSCSKKCVRS